MWPDRPYRVFLPPIIGFEIYTPYGPRACGEIAMIHMYVLDDLFEREASDSRDS